MDEFTKEAKDLGVTLRENEYEKLMLFKAELLEWNKTMNLTSIPESKIDTKHFLDSLSLIPHIPKEVKNAIDIGSGAGFPGIPLNILLPHIQMTLVESVGKKTKFLEHVKEKLSLENIEIKNVRAEDLGQDSKFREKYDVAFGRAVALLPTLLEYTIPFLKVGGFFIAQKSTADELASAERTMETLGVKFEKVVKIILPGQTERVLLIIKKIKQTSIEFPRNPALIKKYPL